MMNIYKQLHVMFIDIQVTMSIGRCVAARISDSWQETLAQSAMQAAKQPSQDLSALECEKMSHLSEHMLYMQRKQQALLIQSAKHCAKLQDLSSALNGFNSTCALPHLLKDQVTQNWWMKLHSWHSFNPDQLPGNSKLMNETSLMTLILINCNELGEGKGNVFS